MSEPLLRHVSAGVHGRMLVRPPARVVADLWLIGFHGYAQSAADLLPGLERAARSGAWLVASVQALHPFYTKGSDVVANWMTREDRELAIADNIAYVDRACDAIEQEFGAPRAIVYAGFSQGVAMAYRAALKGRRRAVALFVVGGDLPPELHGGGTQAWPRVSLLTGADDVWYDAEHLAADASRVREAGGEARPQVFAGGHEWNEAVVEALAGVLGEVERQ